MAKFTNKDLRLKDGQKITWGTDLDANMFMIRKRWLAEV